MLDVTEQLRRYGDAVGAAVEAAADARAVPKRPKGRGRLLLAVAAVLVLLVGAAVLLTRAGDEDASTVDQPEEAPRDLTRGDLVVESRHLIWALQDERAATAVQLLDAEDLVELPVEDVGEARRRTDSAIDELRELTANGNAASPYLEPDALVALRSDVDASVQDFGSIMGLVGRYNYLVTAMIDTNDLYLGQIDDRGVRLVVSGLEGEELTMQLSFFLLQGLVGTGGIDTSEEVAEVSGQSGVLRNVEAEIADLAEGTQFEDAARTLGDGLDADGFRSKVEESLVSVDGQTLPVAELLQRLTLPSGGLWRGFVEDVVADLDD